MTIFIAASCASAPTQTTSVSATAAESPNTTTASIDADTYPTIIALTTHIESAVAQNPSLSVTLIDELGNEVTVTLIDRIIPLDGTVAEVVFALGLGDNVVAINLSATYPPQADALPEIGFQRSLTAESIAAFAPTVLLATDIAGPEGTIEDLRRLGLTLVIVPNAATADSPAAKIRAVANALGVADSGEQLASALEVTLAESNKTATPDATVIAAMYLRGASTQLILGRSSATDWLIKAAGGVDAADALGLEESAPISPEALLVAAPDVLFIPAAGLSSVGGIDGLFKIGSLSQTPAGKNRAVLVYDDQILLGNGPRTGELLTQMISDLNDLVNQ